MKNDLFMTRRKLHISQEEMARRTGVSRQTIVAVEQGKYAPSLTLAMKMARELGKSVDELFTLEDDD